MIIGLCGNKRAGKDTFADHLIETFKTVDKCSFASPLKEACRIMFCLSDEQIDGNLKEVIDPRWGLSPRQMFQTFGTDLVREQYGKIVPGTKIEKIGNSFWVYRLKIWYDVWKKKNPNKCLIVTDIRFPDEHEALKEMGAIIVKVTRPEKSCSDTHVSEQYATKMEGDYSITNETTIDEYKKKIENLYIRILKNLDDRKEKTEKTEEKAKEKTI